MEWFWVTVVYLWLAAMGALVVLVLYSWLNAAAEQGRAAATEREHSRRAVP